MSRLSRFTFSNSLAPRSMCARFAGASLVLIFISLSLAVMVQAQADPAATEISPANLTFTTIDVPGAAITGVEGINTAGNMVGYYAAATYNSPAHGFLYVGGNFTFFDYPGADETFGQGINDSGVISGTAVVNPEAGEAVGFTYNGSTFTTINVHGQSSTQVFGINNAGDVVGEYGAGGGSKAFELVGSKIHTISPPGVPFQVNGGGVNNLGEVVGSASAATEYGWVYNKGKFQTIVVPGSNGLTEVWDINDSRTIVGWYQECTSGCYVHGFALRNGKYLTLDYPGALDTFAIGVNSSGQIVGAYTLADMSQHGFVTTPVMAADFEASGCCDLAIKKLEQ